MAYRMDDIKAAPIESFDLEKAALKAVLGMFRAWSPKECSAFDIIKPIINKLKAQNPIST